MKNLFYILCFAGLLYSCGSTNKNAITGTQKSDDKVVIGNDSLEFELLIFDADFKQWLMMQPSMESYDLSYLKNKNRRFVTQYNINARHPQGNKGLYPHIINYEFDIEYGKKLNYMLYNYFVFFQEKYDQRL